MQVIIQHPKFQQIAQMSNEFGYVIVVLIVGATNLYLYCYFGKLSTESFAKMTECLFECEWQRMEIRVQKYLIMMIANSQKPIYYHGFSVAVLDLETFAKVSEPFSLIDLFKIYRIILQFAAV